MAHVPFGGLGSSGVGRLGGLESVRAFTDQHTVYCHGLGLLRARALPGATESS